VDRPVEGVNISRVSELKGDLGLFGDDTFMRPGNVWWTLRSDCTGQPTSGRVIPIPALVLKEESRGY